jgi:phosphoinositide-3-kinase regulatory subunit 4
MGNTQSGYTLTRTAATLDSFVSELSPEIVYEKRCASSTDLHRVQRDDVLKSLGSSRFLKTVRCRHRNGPVLVKIYIKPDLGLSLGKYQRNLKGMWYDSPPHC